MKFQAFFALILGTAMFANAQQLPPLASHMASQDTVNAEIPLRKEDPLKKPAIALGLSILIPGAGQVYNGQVVKGVVVAGMFYGGVVLLNQAKITKDHYSITAFGWMSVILTAGTDIWNMIDAATTAEELSESPLPAEHALMIQVGPRSIDLDFTMVSRSPGLSMSIRF